MNEIINKSFLKGNKFMSEMYQRQPGFTYSACGLFKTLKKPFIQDIFVKTN